MLQRWTTAVLVFALLAMGTGVLQFVHDQTHLLDRAYYAALRNPNHIHAADRPTDSPLPDDSNCGMCLLLHLPIALVSAVPALIIAGLFIAFLSELTPVVSLRRIPVRVDCRGPPR